MASEEKDRLGNKLRDVEKAREDQWAAQRDRELLEKLRGKQAELQAAAAEAGKKMGALCPHCQRQLEQTSRGGVTMMVCPQGDGAWLDKAALEALLARRA